MKRYQKIQTLLALLASLLILGILSGCSLLNAPTASNTEPQRELWNPEPGDEIITGREVPILNDDYWGGQEINPLRRMADVEYIDAETGGTVQLGYHHYDIPAGAIDNDMAFTMAYGSFQGVAVDCEPSPFQFNCPITLTLSYAGTQYEEDGYDPSVLQIFYVTLDGEYIPLESRVDLENRTVSTETDHFSRYIIG